MWLVAVGWLAGCTTPTVGPAEPTGFVVLGAASLPEYEGAAAQMNVPFAVARVAWRGSEFELDGLQARLHVVADPVLRAGPLLSATLPRTRDAQSSVVASLPERDLALEAGGFVGFRLPIESLDEGSFSGTVALRRDVTGVHDGTLASAKLDAFFAPSYMLRLGSSIQATYASGEYANAYFTVDDSGAMLSGLPTFDAGSGWKDVTCEVYSILSFSERVGLFSRIAYTRLIEDAAESPIVDLEGEADQWFFGVGAFFRF